MSWIDDRKDEIEAPVQAAILKSIYGEKAATPAFALATQVELVGLLLRSENGAPDFQRPLDSVEEKIIKRCAGWLLVAALTGHLEEVATALVQCPAPNVDCQRKVLDAYLGSIRGDGSPPTDGEVRAEFLRQNKASLLPKAGVTRDMVLNTFGLPLSKARRGRPRKSQP